MIGGTTELTHAIVRCDRYLIIMDNSPIANSIGIATQNEKCGRGQERLMTGDVELVCLSYLPEYLSLTGKFIRELIVNGNLFDDIDENEGVIQDFDNFRVSAHRGTGGNIGIDRYYLTGKSWAEAKISMDITHYPSHNIARINFNNLNDDWSLD